MHFGLYAEIKFIFGKNLKLTRWIFKRNYLLFSLVGKHKVGESPLSSIPHKKCTTLIVIIQSCGSEAPVAISMKRKKNCVLPLMCARDSLFIYWWPSPSARSNLQQNWSLSISALIINLVIWKKTVRPHASTWKFRNAGQAPILQQIVRVHELEKHGMGRKMHSDSSKENVKTDFLMEMTLGSFNMFSIFARVAK